MDWGVREERGEGGSKKAMTGVEEGPGSWVDWVYFTVSDSLQNTLKYLSGCVSFVCLHSLPSEELPITLSSIFGFVEGSQKTVNFGRSLEMSWKISEG